MTTYARNQNIAKHNLQEHGFTIRTGASMKDIKMLYSSNEKIDLLYAETVLIKSEQPSINNQKVIECRILKVF